MAYKVIVTRSATDDIARCIRYLLNEKKNRQAAGNVLDDYENTLIRLGDMAETLKLADNPKLAEIGYRRINFGSHNYFMMYRIVDDEVYVDRVFHGLQDYENRMV